MKVESTLTKLATLKVSDLNDDLEGDESSYQGTSIFHEYA